MERLARDVRPFVRFARRYRAFMREPVDAERACIRVRDRLAGREEGFLELARRCLELRVEPALGPLDESRVRSVFLAALEDDRRARPMAAIWKQAEDRSGPPIVPAPDQHGEDPSLSPGQAAAGVGTDGRPLIHRCRAL